MDPDSERVYGRHFFTGLDGVAAALDNVEARQYSAPCPQNPKYLPGTLRQHYLQWCEAVKPLVSWLFLAPVSINKW